MDRQIVYVGAIPQDVDQLLQNKSTMIGLGYALQAILGTSTLVDGLACNPTGPASLNVTVGNGSIYSLQNIDGTAYGSLNADTADQIVKQGLSLPTQTFSCPAPSTSGFSVVYLVEAAYEDVDAGSTVLSYYNASNPSQAYNGPNNTGTSQNTVRQGVCTVQVKTGVAATTGTQVTPTPDAGYTGLYAVTVAHGQTTITSGNIVQLATAPFVNPKLGGFIAAIQNGTGVYVVDTSVTANTITIAPTPAFTSLGAGATVRVKVANTVTGATVMNTNGLGNVSVKTPAGSAIANGAIVANGVYEFVHDGSNWEVQTATAYGSMAPLNIGNNLANDGSGNAVGTVPPVSLTGANKTFSLSQWGAQIARSNSGTAMADSLPGTSGALPSGWYIEVQNTDATGADVVNVGSGGSLSMGNQNLSSSGFAILPGETYAVFSQGSGAYVVQRISAALLHAAPVQSEFKGLTAAWASNTTFTLAASEIVLEDSNGNTRKIKNFSQTVNSATSGAGGLDTGSIASNTWYYGYAIFNPATGTQAGLMSASVTSPTLPSGYTLSSGPLTVVITDGSANFIGFKQIGRNWQYLLGSNLTGIPLLFTGAHGTLGSAWATVGITGIVPTSLAATIRISQQVLASGSNTSVIAPSSNYMNPSLGVMYLSSGGSSASQLGEFVIETTSIAVQSQANAAAAVVGCTLNI